MSSDILGPRNGGVDWTPVPQTALVIHPAKAGDGHLRTPQMRLEEAVGLAEALDLEVKEALVEVLPRDRRVLHQLLRFNFLRS